MNDAFPRELAAVADFYDQRLVGDVGPLGFRRTSELGKILACMPKLVSAEILDQGRSRFLDLGCGDGRVNVLMSFVARISIGVELDEWTLDEYGILRERLDASLAKQNLRPVPSNIHLFHGDATEESVHGQIRVEAGVALDEVDIFYTYLSGHEEFARLIAKRGKFGSVFLVYGMNRVFPRYDGLDLVESLSPLGGVLAVYKKTLQVTG
jgi:hypothetical protein